MTSSAGYRAVALAAGLGIITLVAMQLMTLLLAVMIMLILALPLSAAASQAERVGLPRAVGALAAVMAALIAVTAIGLLVVPEFVEQAKQFSQRLPSIFAGAQRYLHHVGGLRITSISTEVTHVVRSYTQEPQRLIGPFEQLGSTAAGIVGAVVLIGLGAFLIAVNPEPLLSALLRLMPMRLHPQARDVLARVRTAWIGWMIALGLDMLVLGGLLLLGMTIIGLPFALGFAVLSALLTVIPNYGSIISAIPPVLVGLAQSPGEAALVVLVYVIVNQIEGNLILPLIMARTVDMHPAVVSIGLLVMAALFGLIGVLLAIPLLSLMIVTVQVLWVEPQEAAASPTAGVVRVSSD